MAKKHVLRKTAVTMGAAMLLLVQGSMQYTFAAPLPGGTLDPLTVPKYVTPLVIPPEMPRSPAASPLNTAPQPAADYNISVRQFKQQILPAGLPATTVWSYGRAEDVLPTNFTAPAPLAQGISFNYPSFTVEATSGLTTKVRWINDLKDPLTGNFLPHLFAVDQTLHWANPPGGTAGRDRPGIDPTPYLGPVPIVTHLHGAHVNPQSDGYPTAWYLPAAGNILSGYATQGSNFGQFDLTNTVPGSAFFGYENTQSATTLWFHDHTLGMTRLNVYAGPAGFWLVRGGANGDTNVKDGVTGLAAKLPGPAPIGAGDPNFDPAYRATIREIPLAIQDRSFNTDGSLFYPDSRAFFDTFAGPYAPTSDIAPIWNPEAFFNTMVVNGSTWPKLEVAPAKYRFRILNGSNSRFLNLALNRIQVNKGKQSGQEFSFYQIGADQGFLPKVVEIRTGFATPLPGNGTMPARVKGPNSQQALLMGPSERADVVVDFSGLANGTIVQLINTAPDAPFGGFPDIPADPGTTGQVMQFVVNTALLQPTDAATTSPLSLVLPADTQIGPATAAPRSLSLNEMESSQVCVAIDAAGNITTLFTTAPNDPNFLANCAAAGGVPQAPKAALLGTFDPATSISTPLMFHELLTENPALGSTEEWELNNLTVDAHPIHVHQVKFQVINRQLLDPLTLLPVGVPTPPLSSEAGYKDTVIAYPGQVTRIRSTFDIPGLYIWHCHILEHEDNEMMRSFRVGP